MLDALVLSHQVPEDWRAQAEVFGEIFSVFLVIGTIVGVVVVSYTLYHAYKARDRGRKDDGSFDPPVLGELPSGQTGPKSKKLFVSFGISAVIVISLVVYSYFLLLYVEQGPTEDVEAAENAEQLEVEVVGIQFGWQFHYPNGAETFNELRVPEGEVIRLTVTSDDVWHNFGVPELRVKADSIPGQYSDTWFIANETGTYTANCYELCGRGHSEMSADVIVMENEEFDEWYENQAAEGDDSSEEEASNDDGDGGGHGRLVAPAPAAAGSAGVIAT